ncbi:MAG: hypothetical protein SFT94_02565, partial [Pseudanabaenaceae cyanobacterium bins.68]|nr:hypothetical protein [Pseudanabaenaceae cyanobacterium bins.68]
LRFIRGLFELAFEAQGLSLVEFVGARYDYIDDFTISKDKIGEIIEIAKLGLDSLCAKIY